MHPRIDHAVRAVLACALLAANGWLATAAAQATGADTSTSIAQPTPDAPGLVVGVTLGELYTDNLYLAAEGQPRQDAWVTEVKPFIRAARRGPRFAGVFDYSASGYFYAGRSGDNQVAQNLDSRGTLTVVPEHLFVDGTASYHRAVVAEQLPAGTSDFLLDGNHANVATTTLSPWWQQSLGGFANMRVRYTRGRVVFGDGGISGNTSGLLDGVSDISSDAVQFNLASQGGHRWGWNFGYSGQRLRPDAGHAVRFAEARLGATYTVNLHLQLLADAGRETRWLPDGGEQALGAPFWDAGFEWAGRRNTFRLQAGHRFFGRSFTLSWRHQAARLTTNLAYVEQPTSNARNLLGMDVGAPLLPPSYFNGGVGVLAEQQPYLSKRFTASLAYSLAYGTLQLSADDERRTYLAPAVGPVPSDGLARIAHASLGWTLDLGAATTLTPSFNWQRYRFEGGEANLDRYVGAELAHRVNARNIASLRVRHDTRTTRSAYPGDHGYDLNVVFLEWTHLL